MSSPPIPRDVQDFQFKLVSRFKVFNKTEGLLSGPVNALAVSSKHGLVFVASPSEIQISETSLLLENRVSKGSGADVEVFHRRCIPLNSCPTHIGISCDQVHVAVALAPKDSQSCAVALIYPITSFISKDPSPAWEFRLSSTPGVTVRDLVWNPGLPQLLCICLSNGSVFVYELKGTSQTFQIFSLPESTLALSVSWSPKGKQLVIGSANGTLSQYKPDLKLVKTIPAPPPNPGISADGNIAPVSLLWLSSFQFAVVYGNPSDNGSGSSRPGLHIVNAPKGGAVSYLNYDDICYSSGELRPIQYYLTHQPKWNVLLMSSANSTEVGVLAADGSGVEPLVWEQWALEDASRAELPLSSSREEMYAIGMAIDTSPTVPLPWGENQTIPPAPLLIILSHHGLLCTFHMINLRPGAAQDLCFPPELIPGIRELFVNSGPPSSSHALPIATPGNAPAFGSLPVIGGESSAFPMTSKSSFSFAPSSQSPSSLFSSAPASQSFASLSAASTTPSLFGAQTQKADTEKGWLSGQGGNTFGGFGGLGSTVTQSKEETSSSAGSSFSFASSSASTVILGTATTAVTSLSNQSQAAPTFSFVEQSQPPMATQMPTLATQPARPPAEGFPSFGAASMAPKPLSGDKGKTGGLSLGLTTAGKLKFGSTTATPDSGGNNTNSGVLNMGSPQQSWTAPSTGLTIPKVSAAVSRTEVQSTAPVSNIITSQPQTASSVSPVVSDVAIFRAIVKETELFEKELALLKERDQKLNIEIGSPSEKKHLVQKVDAMDNFLCELSETTHGQASEIAALRTLLVEAFAWVEEARSRHLYSKNPRYLHLAMNQGLDPVIKKYLLAIRNRIHYLDTQLQQIDYNLDNQWSTFQNTCSKRSRRKNDWTYGGYSPESLQRKEIHMPSLEYVYQTILSQQKVLERHKVRLDELEAKLKDRAKWELGNSLYAASSGFPPRKNRGSPNTHKRSSLSDQDLSSMAESLLALQLGGSKLNGGFSAQLGSKHPLLPKKMSSRHTSQLCHLLAHRPMTRVLPSSRSISSSAVLHFPANLMDSMAVSPAKTQATTSQSLSLAISSDVPVKSSTPVNKEMPSSKSVLTAPISLSTPAAISPASVATLSAVSMTTKAPTSASSPAFGMSVASPSNSMLGQSVPAMNFSAPSRSSPAPGMGFSAPGMGSLAISSSAPVKASAVPALGTSIQGMGSFSLTMGPSSPTASSSPLGTVPTTQILILSAPATTTSTLVFSSPALTKSTTLQAPSGSMFGGMPSSAVTTTSSEGNMWAFSTSGSFSIGSSAKPGGISTGKPVVPPVATPASPFVPTTTTSTSTPQAFSLNFSVPANQPSKSSFLGSKPLSTQSPFSLPSSTFGLQNASASSAKEPLFVFGGSSLGANIKATPAEEPISDGKKEETQKEEKEFAEKEEKKEETGSGDNGVIAESKENSKEEMIEKQSPTFSFGSAFGSSTISFGKSSPLVPSTSSSVTITPSSAIPLPSPEYEDITPENKAEGSDADKAKSEEKPPPARSLFSEFNFKLSGNKSEIFGAKPPASIFGGSSTPAASSSPIAPSLFGTPTAVAASPLSPVSTTSVTATMPIISQAEPPSTASNPLSSLGNIVASLGSNTFNKQTTEANKPSSTFSSFSFSLPSKDDGIKSLPPDAATASPGDSQKTPIKAFPAATPPADSSSATTPVAGSLSSGSADFGQGLANILGQSLPSSTSPVQQQSVQNPFAGTSGLFSSGSSTSSPSTTSLFGKPSEGSVFGQSLKQDETTTSFFGSSPNTAPATTSAPTFGTGSVFGQGTSPSGSIFGGSGFGSSKPIFGQTTASTGFSLGGSVFGQNVGTSSSTPVFGPPPASTSGGSPFQAQATASSSVFGSSSSGDNRGSLFGSVAQSGFGSPGSSSFQAKPGGFGGSPVFGAMGSGNTSPSFGGAATFGSPPTFGSHVFGSSTGGGSLFGGGLQSQGTAPASTFENLATAQTLTFGNLAQSSNSGSPFGAVPGGSTSQTPPAFGSAGASGTGSGTTSFGGSSFTSWR